MDILKSLFAPIEKLITEHGSASILRDHVNLLREKFSSLEEENAILDKKNKELTSQLENATKEIERINKLTQKPQRATYQEDKKLNEVTEQILQQFFKTKNGLPIQYFVSSLSLDFNTVKYHFDILSNRNFIHLPRRAWVSFKAGSKPPPETWEITEKGRKYIVEQMNK